MDFLANAGIMVFIWLALVILFVVVELFTLDLTSIWFAAGALVAGLVAMFSGPFWAQALVFVAVTAVLLASTRKIAKRHLDNKIEKTNSESLIGKTSFVIEEVNNVASTGKIRIGDVEWTARAVNETEVIPVNTKIVIREIRGVKCMVESAQEHAE